MQVNFKTTLVIGVTQQQYCCFILFRNLCLTLFLGEIKNSMQTTGGLDEMTQVSFNLTKGPGSNGLVLHTCW